MLTDLFAATRRKRIQRRIAIAQVIIDAYERRLLALTRATTPLALAVLERPLAALLLATTFSVLSRAE